MFKNYLIFFCWHFFLSNYAWSTPIDEFEQLDALQHAPKGLLDQKVIKSSASEDKKELPKSPLLNENKLNKRSNETAVAGHADLSGKAKKIEKGSKNDAAEDFYLFEQDELDAQKPGLEIYQTLMPKLSHELKKDAKKLWVETADIRKTLSFDKAETDSDELILQKSTKEMALVNGKALDGANINNLPPALYNNKEPDKTLIKALYDDFYLLLRNAFFIIVGILIVGKIVSVMVKAIIKDMKQRKERKLRRHRSRKKRRRTYAEV